MIICLGLLTVLCLAYSRETLLISSSTRDNALYINLRVTLSSSLGIFKRLLLFLSTLFLSLLPPPLLLLPFLPLLLLFLLTLLLLF